MTQTAGSPELTPTWVTAPQLWPGVSFPEEPSLLHRSAPQQGSHPGETRTVPRGPAGDGQAKPQHWDPTEDVRSPTSGLLCVPPAVRRACLRPTEGY